jgi:hypothetical protein
MQKQFTSLAIAAVPKRNVTSPGPNLIKLLGAYLAYLD